MPSFSKNQPAISLWIKQRRLLAFLGVVIILGGGWWLIWRPAWQATAALPSIDSFQEPAQRIENDRKILQEINSRFAAVNSDKIERLKIILPAGQDLPNLIAQLEGIAKINKFALLSVDFITSSETSGSGASDSQADAALRLLHINLALGPGSYEQFKSFLADVENSLRLLTVTGVSFNFSGDNIQSGYLVNLASPYLSKN